MKCEVIKGRLTVGMYELFEHLTADELLDLAQMLGCIDAVIKAIADQLIDGSTENGSWGGKGYSLPACSALDVARTRIAEGASAIAVEEIKKATAIAASAEESRNEAWARAHAAEDMVSTLRSELRAYREASR